MEPGITRESTREPGGLLVTLGIILGLRAPSPVYPARAPLSTLSSPWVPGLGPPQRGPWVPAGLPNAHATTSNEASRLQAQSSQHLSTLHCHKHQGEILGTNHLFTDFSDFLGIILRVLLDNLVTWL